LRLGRRTIHSTDPNKRQERRSAKRTQFPNSAKNRNMEKHVIGELSEPSNCMDVEI
jgi:hypothetical protein